MPFPVDAKWINATQEKMGGRFPASFVVAMSKLNGGAVVVGNDQYELCPFLDQSDRKRIGRTCNSICRETEWMRQWEFFADDLVVIGKNGGGDLLVLMPMVDEPTNLQHTVYWWDHETSQTEAVADDFSELEHR